MDTVLLFTDAMFCPLDFPRKLFFCVFVSPEDKPQLENEM